MGFLSQQFREGQWRASVCSNWIKRKTLWIQSLPAKSLEPQPLDFIPWVDAKCVPRYQGAFSTPVSPPTPLAPTSQEVALPLHLCEHHPSCCICCSSQHCPTSPLHCVCFCILQPSQRHENGTGGVRKYLPSLAMNFRVTFSLGLAWRLPGILYHSSLLMKMAQSRRNWTSKQFWGPWTTLHLKSKCYTGSQLFI